MTANTSATDGAAKKPRGERLLIRRQLGPEKGIFLSDTRLWQLRKDGLFPQPVRVSAHRIAFRESDIDRWIAERPTVGSADDHHAAADRANARKAVDARRAKRRGK